MAGEKLFQPCELGGLKLQNRIALSPTTRARATPDGYAGDLQRDFYTQRASAGILITEATAVVPGGRGGPFLPGLWEDAQIDGWKQVNDSVHEKGAKIFCQLWHAGRLSHSSLSADGKRAPVAPSEFLQPGKIFTEQGPQDYELAHALTIDEIAEIVSAYRDAARRAKEADFDGVELHAAHSYLVSAFLNDMTNKRDDDYGGSIENRCRFLKEVLGALLDVWEPERVMIRIAPLGHAYNTWDTNPEPLFTRVVDILNELKIGWLDLVEGDTGVTRKPEPYFDLSKLARQFHGPVILNNLYTREMAIEAMEQGAGDMVAFGRAFIGNPDLVARLEADAPIIDADQRAYYSGGARGYTDFPTLAES
ncbi:alkene reductase [Ponticaulis profundi]|uniref:Alkene reductase n=1 Tax=Ponticaulis profundi TaxID=2665222 RepID=A0ABW1S7T2_9PROT